MQPQRPLRADAKRNLDLLVAAADAEFAARGANASLEDIAKRAGVGIATQYRNFPTRDDLIGRVLAAGNDAVVARAKCLHDSPKPGEALAIWLRELVDHVTTYRGLIGAVATSFTAENGTQLCATCGTIADAGAALLARAQKAGEIRGDAEAWPDVMVDDQGELYATATRGTLRMVDFRGVPTAALVYDDEPVMDHFVWVDPDTRLGVMDRAADRDADSWLYFWLERRPPAPVRAAAPPAVGVTPPS
jgi:AcrR family transcriptional regulator